MKICKSDTVYVVDSMCTFAQLLTLPYIATRPSYYLYTCTNNKTNNDTHFLQILSTLLQSINHSIQLTSDTHCMYGRNWNCDYQRLNNSFFWALPSEGVNSNSNYLLTDGATRCKFSLSLHASASHLPLQCDKKSVGWHSTTVTAQISYNVSLKSIPYFKLDTNDKLKLLLVEKCITEESWETEKN